MTVEKLSEDVLFVTLSTDEKVSDKLKAVNELIDDRKDCDIIIDFSLVQIITSVSISNLLILQQLLKSNGHQLILI